MKRSGRARSGRIGKLGRSEAQIPRRTGQDRTKKLENRAEIRRRSDLGRFGAIKVVQGTAVNSPKSAQERSETRPGRPKSATGRPRSGPRRPESLQNDARTALQPLRCTVRTAFRRETSSQARSQRSFQARVLRKPQFLLCLPPRSVGFARAAGSHEKPAKNRGFGLQNRFRERPRRSEIDPRRTGFEPERPRRALQAH